MHSQVLAAVCRIDNTLEGIAIYEYLMIRATLNAEKAEGGVQTGSGRPSPREIACCSLHRPRSSAPSSS